MGEKSLLRRAFRPLLDTEPELPISSFASLGGFVIRSPSRTPFRLFLGSSAVEHSTVNRMVAGSNPARGASQIKHLSQKRHFRPKPSCLHCVCKRVTPERAMSDELDWNFVDRDDAKAEIRAAVEYLLRGATGGARGDIVQEILAIVRDAANGQRPDPLDDDMPGG